VLKAILGVSGLSGANGEGEDLADSPARLTAVESEDGLPGLKGRRLQPRGNPGGATGSEERDGCTLRKPCHE